MANSRASLLLCGALLALGPACGSSSGGAEATPPAPEDPNDPTPTFTAEQRSALAGLRYDSSSPPQDVSNAVADDAAARVFGQRLFFETAFSGALLEPDNTGTPSHLGKKGETGKVSCAGCHVPADDFVDTRSPHRQISLAAGWTQRRSPSLLEVAFMPLYNWDGRRDTLWNQAIGVMENASEFNTSRLFVAQQIFELHRAEYEAVFGALPDLTDTTKYPALSAVESGCDGITGIAVCRGKPGDKADYDGMTEDAQREVTTVAVNVGKAIAAYLRLLRCGSSRFEGWLDGDESALSRSEQRGAALFVGKAKCVDCHSGPNLSDGKFHNVGLRPATVAVAFTDTGDRGAAQGIAEALNDPLGSAGPFSDGDRGKLPAAVAPELEGAFRTPMLRCLDRQPSFMHTGQLQSLSAVIRFFNRGGDPAGFPGTNELVPLGLSELEAADLEAFIRSLEGPGAEPRLRVAPAP
jgi:cytochrome c peroxidase